MLNRLSEILILLTAALVLLCSCQKDTSPTPDPTRVLLVYVGTDNNLSGLEQEKLAALRQGWTGRPNDRIIVYRDTRNAGARLIEISNLSPNENPREIATYGTENSADPATLTRVINYVQTMYPADSYGLLIFSHASGWLPQGVYNEFAAGRVPASASRHCEELVTKQSSNGDTSSSRSIIVDGTDEMGANGHSEIAASSTHSRSIIVDGTDEMELTDLAAAIPDGMFDYIVFETCFMAGIEVAWELRDKAPLIFASSAEIVHPGFAPVYSTATRQMFGQNLAGFGQSVFTHTLTYAENNPQRSGTYSVINTAALNTLADFIRDNCDFTRDVNITDIQHFDRLTVCHLFFDFGDYYGRLLDTDTQRTEFDRLMKNCIMWKAATEEFMTQAAGYNGFSISHHSGLTTYIPQQQYPGLNSAHDQLGWTQAVRPD